MRTNHFPHYAQHDASDCGPTCLRMIAKYYGKEYSAEMLRRHCYISREGVSMLGISDAAEFVGFRTLGVLVTFEQLAEEALLPCILHWNQNHFVVCYRITKGKKGKYNIYISDPASQRLCYTKDEFLRCWASNWQGRESRGTALLLEPGIDFGKIADEVSVDKRGLSSFLSYFLPYRGQLVQLLLCMLTGSLIQLLFPFLTQAMVDWGIGERSLDIITLVLLAQLVLFLAQLCVGFIRGWLLLHINSRIDISLISGLTR